MWKLHRDWVWWTIACRCVHFCCDPEVLPCSSVPLNSEIFLCSANNNTLCDQSGNCIQKERQEMILCSLCKHIQALLNRRNIYQELCWNLETQRCLGHRTRGLGLGSGGDRELIIRTLPRFRSWNQMLTVTGLGCGAFGRQLWWGLCLTYKAEWGLPHCHSA